MFNTSVTGANGTPISNGSTITLTENSTRPQSVWYTVSASGQVKNGGSEAATPITQASYTLTQDETNNIFAVSSNKIAGFSSSGGTGNYTVTGYSTAVGGTSVQQGSSGGTATPVATPSANGLQTNNTAGAGGVGARTDGTTITINQNYLPLGITSAVKDAYFNHNGII